MRRNKTERVNIRAFRVFTGNNPEHEAGIDQVFPVEEGFKVFSKNGGRTYAELKNGIIDENETGYSLANSWREYSIPRFVLRGRKRPEIVAGKVMVASLHLKQAQKILADKVPLGTEINPQREIASELGSIALVNIINILPSEQAEESSSPEPLSFVWGTTGGAVMLDSYRYNSISNPGKHADISTVVMPKGGSVLIARTSENGYGTFQAEYVTTPVPSIRFDVKTPETVVLNPFTQTRQE